MNILTQQWFWIGIVFAPVVLALLFAPKPRADWLIRAAPWTAFPALLTAILAEPGHGIVAQWFLSGASFGMDATAKTFLFFTALIWFTGGLYATAYLKTHPKRFEFFVYYLLAMSGNMGLILAQDVISFYFLFGLMSFASYGLVVFSRTPEAYRAGTVYIALVVIGEILIFSGMLLAIGPGGSIYISDLYQQVAGSVHRDWIIGLILAGFGIKAGMLPLHVWLPLAHPVAPTPASAILSGSMINAGLIGWLRFFPLGETALPEWGQLIVGLGIFGSIYGALIGITQRQAKSVLAYSSISQMGVMTIMVGLGLMYPKAWIKIWPVLMIYAAHHGIAKAGLFLSVGLSDQAVRSRRALVGLYGSLLIPALAIAGAPFTSGAFAKGSLKYVLKHMSTDGYSVAAVKWWISIGAIGTTLLMARFIWMIRPNRPQRPANVNTNNGCYGYWGVVLLIILIMPAIIEWQSFIGVVKKNSLYWFSWSSGWPLIAGLAASALAVVSGLKNQWPVPAGDVLLIYEKLWKYLRRGMLGVSSVVTTTYQALVETLTVCGRTVNLPRQNLDKIAEMFSAWRVFGTLFLILFTLLFMLSAVG